MLSSKYWQLWRWLVCGSQHECMQQEQHQQVCSSAARRSVIIISSRRRRREVAAAWQADSCGALHWLLWRHSSWFCRGTYKLRGKCGAGSSSTSSSEVVP
jgi:hypothetical protein